jgi:3',5'-cyclic AMP phosphodiesterase CpdA
LVPFTVVQLSDPHLGARWSTTGAAGLAGAVEAVEATLGAAPDAVILTGDIASTPTDAEYTRARELVAALDAPIHAVPGNHDDPEAVARHFPPPASAVAGIGYTAELGPVRLLALDSTRPDGAGGRLGRPRLDWLDEALARGAEAPTMIAMHHPPLPTGVPAMDTIGIDVDERRALEEILRRHRQVQLIACGHVHRTVAGTLGPATVLAIPSTDLQLALDFAADELRFVAEPRCFAVHALLEGRLVSHVQPF